MSEAKVKKVSKGGKNLIILGIISCLIALGTTGVSLAIYHNTGDIYLDRSRPGYLPDEAEIESEEEKTEDAVYSFNKDQEITASTLGEYVEELYKEAEAIDAHKDPFGLEALSDESLGIPVANENENEPTNPEAD